MTKRGPIQSPDEWIPGSDKTSADGDCTYDGVDGPEYSKHKGSGGKIKEVTFDKAGVFGRIPQED
jgi:hypothetical protein